MRVFLGTAIRSALAIAGALLATAPVARADSWELGWQASRYRYDEPDLMHLAGYRFGLVGAYTIARGTVFHKFDVRGSYGSLRYEGSGVQEGVPDYLMEVRWVVGRRLDRQLSPAPYAGLGYRYLFSDSRGLTSTGAAGYRRFSNYLYAPIGVSWRTPARGEWILAPTFEWDIFLRGWQITKLSDAGFGNTDVTNKQSSGYGYRLAAMFENQAWSWGPWLHYWNIKDSDVQPIGLGQVGWEPANHTLEFGLEIRRRF
jgi:hypothetical protein